MLMRGWTDTHVESLTLLSILWNGKSWLLVEPPGYTVITNVLKQILRQMGYEHMSEFYYQSCPKDKALRKPISVISLYWRYFIVEQILKKGECLIKDN